MDPNGLFLKYFFDKVTFVKQSADEKKPCKITHHAKSLKTYAAISNAHLFRACKRGKLSGSCLSTLNGFGSTQLPIFLCHIGVPTFSSQNN